MKKLLITLVLGGFVIAANAQGNSYPEDIAKAWNLYEKKEFRASAEAYLLAFTQNNWKSTADDQYNAACSWALAGNIDSAFRYLFNAAEKYSYNNLSHITTDTDLNDAHKDPRWEKLLVIIKANKEKAEANYIKPVVAQLDTILQDDQKTRKGIVELIQKEGMESPVVKARLAEMHILDSINLVKTTRILDEYGWLGFDKIGRMGALTIFLVVQHSPLPVQQKYLPMMREAVKNKQAVAGNLALLEDRVALGEGRKQVYGSQVYMDTASKKQILFPLEDPENVDKRRKEVGLGPLADYLRSFGIEWDVKAYKKKLEEAEKKKN